MKLVKSLMVGLLLAVLCATGAAAYESPEALANMTLEEAVADFLTQNGLNEEDFALSYYNTVTGETYGYRDTQMMVAASTFKLPLNLYYYDLERQGEIDPDAWIEGAGTTLSDAHYQSLVYSNNDVSIGLLYNLGDFRTYKTLMRKYFTMTDEEIDYIYYVDNYYCTRMMLDALKYLYDNSADFEEMLGYMKEAQPGEYFKAGVPEEYEVAHKYGWFEGAVNDVGIIYTPEPFLLAVYTQDMSAAVVADAAALMTDYNLAHAQPEEVAEEDPIPEEDAPGTIHLEIEEVPPEAETAPEEITLPAEETAPEVMTAPADTQAQEAAPQMDVLWWLAAAAALVLLAALAVLLVWALHRSRRRRGSRSRR